MDIRKSLTTQTNGTASKGDLAQSLRRSVTPAASGALAVPDKRTALPADYKGGGAIGYIIDATGSRSATWKEAQQIQRDMFSNVRNMGAMKLRLVHFGGNQLSDRGWRTDPREVAGLMAEVSCMGGSTQINESLSLFDTQGSDKADSIILVGDAFEEDRETAFALAQELAKRRIKIFAFHEGGDTRSEETFRELARITGGAFAKFGPSMPLKDLCNAVAVYSVGGAGALTRLAGTGDRAAKQLAQNTLKLTGPKQP